MKYSILDKKIEELRQLIRAELPTSDYVIDYLIVRLLDGIIYDYQNNYAQKIQYWKEIIQIIKEQIAQGNIDDEVS